MSIYEWVWVREGGECGKLVAPRLTYTLPFFLLTSDMYVKVNVNETLLWPFVSDGGWRIRLLFCQLHYHIQLVVS